MNRTGPPEVHMNWLSRFLHIKPATKTLCFHVGRGKVRGDLVRLLRDWQRFGVRDVTFDRKANIINARVDKVNRKYAPSARFLFNEWGAPELLLSSGGPGGDVRLSIQPCTFFSLATLHHLC